MERGAPPADSRRPDSARSDTRLALKKNGTLTRTEKLIIAARAILAWERLWPALWPGLAFVGAWATLSLFNVFAFLPGFIHVLGLFALTGAAGYFFWRNLQSLRVPRWDEGTRRLERDSGLSHRPLTEAG